MPFNKIAVFGHRGWAGSSIVRALATSGAPLRVLYRPGSDVSSLPRISSVTTVKVDLEDQEAIISALADIDIVLALVGQSDVHLQHAFIRAIPHTNVKLFVPSDLAFRRDEQGLRVALNKTKQDVEDAAKAAGIPTAVVLPGLFAESSLSVGIAGVDLAKNRIIFTGDSANQQLNICTRRYVAAAYASIFASTPVARLQNRDIGISELRVTGEEVRAAMEKKYGAAPEIIKVGFEDNDRELETRAAKGAPFAMAFYARKVWGTGSTITAIGDDVWEVAGFEKANIDDLIVKGQLGSYKNQPKTLQDALDQTFEQFVRPTA